MIRVRTRGFSPRVLRTRWRKLVQSRPYCTQKRISHRRCQPVGASLSSWVCNAPLWEHQCSTRCACSVPLKNPGLGSTTRVRTHGFSRRGLFALCRVIARNCSNCARWDRGSGLLPLDERRDSSLNLREYFQLIMLEAVTSPLARRAVSDLLPVLLGQT